MKNSRLNQSALDQTLPQAHIEEILPFDQRLIQLTQKDYVQLKWQANFWKTQHERSIAREEILKERLKQKEAIIRDLNQRLYGQKSEKSKSKGASESSPNAKDPPSKRTRGQQKGSATHGRTKRPKLPVIPEVVPLSETACDLCGLEYSILSSYEESEVIEIQVAAHVRKIKRQKCVKNCNCTPGSKVITAPAVPKLIPKSPFGNSVWVKLLLQKFLHAQPVNRTLNDLKSLGLTIAPGTVAGGLQKITPLFEPIYKAFHQQQMTENRFHNDETRWEVYQQVEGKAGHRWYLWLTRSNSVVYYCMDPTRSADVPLAHFGDLTSKNVIVVCDRYSAYKKLARLNLAIILAFCWVHVKRDFLNFARSHDDFKEWGLDWVDAISKLFHLNNERVALWDPKLSLTQQSILFQESHKTLGSALEDMKTRCETLLQEDDQAKKKRKPGVLTSVQRKLLVSLKEHWKGLTVFYEHVEVKMDNNPAEQSIRNPVLGRKGYYGSGSLWSAELAAMMFSVFQTMLLWKLNPRTWLHLYFEACAQNKGKSPEDLREFLPWTMNKDRLQQLSEPPDPNTS